MPVRKVKTLPHKDTKLKWLRLRPQQDGRQVIKFTTISKPVTKQLSKQSPKPIKTQKQLMNSSKQLDLMLLQQSRMNLNALVSVNNHFSLPLKSSPNNQRESALTWLLIRLEVEWLLLVPFAFLPPLFLSPLSVDHSHFARSSTTKKEKMVSEKP